MIEPAFPPIVRLVLIIMLGIPLWLVMLMLYSKGMDWLCSKCMGSISPTASLAVFLVGAVLCGKAAFSISSRVLRRDDH